MAVSRGEAAGLFEVRSLDGKSAYGAQIPATGDPVRQGLFIDGLLLARKAILIEAIARHGNAVVGAVLKMPQHLVNTIWRRLNVRLREQQDGAAGCQSARVV